MAQDETPSHPLSEWSDHTCLILLGEGGIGKSNELREEVRRLEAEERNVILADLGTTADRATLLDQVLPSGPPEGSTLLIDGFDEVVADVADISEVLSLYFRSLKTGHLSIRVASRPAVWSTLLQRQLEELWPDAAVLTLDPPTVSDVRTAAELVLRDQAAAFMEALDERTLWTLALSPVTLEFLLDAFAETGGIIGTRLELYRDGVARLVSEHHERRVDRNRTGSPKVQRLAAAQTLAAASLFSGRPTIATRPHPPTWRLDIDDIAGTDGHAIETLREVVQSAIVHPAGAESVTWAHRSVAEFLAAERIRDLPLTTLRNLLGHHEHPDRVAPPLAPVASWVAATRDDVFDWLVAHDLDTVLDANLMDATPAQRQAVADAVLASILAGRGFDWRADALSAVANDRLTEALRTALLDSSVTFEAKGELLQMAWRTQATGLDDVLLALIADGALPDSYGGEVSAGRWALIAAERILDETFEDQLATIATASATNRWVLADLLARLYPRRLGTATVLSLLPDDTLESFDTTFLGVVRLIGEHADDDRQTLIAVLDWFAAHAAAERLGSTGQDALDRVVRSAVAHFDDDDVVDALARLVARQAEQSYGRSLPAGIRDLGAEARRLLLGRVMAEVDDSDKVGYTTLVLVHGLVEVEDFDHYLDRAVAGDQLDPARDHWEVAAAHHALVGMDTSAVESAVAAAQHRYPGAAEDIEALWGVPWQQRLAEDRVLAASHEAERAAERERQVFELAALDLALADGEWPAAANELKKPIVEVEKPWRATERRLSRTEAWHALHDVTRGRLLDLAATALAGLPPGWQAVDSLADAISLLADVAPARLDEAPDERWLELAGPMLGSAEPAEVCGLVVERAARADAAATDKIVLEAIRSDVGKGHALTLDRLGDYRPADFDGVLKSLAADDQTDEHALGRVLADLLSRRADGAADVARSIADDRPGSKPAPPEGADQPVVVDRNVDSPFAREFRRWRRAVAAVTALVEAPAGSIEGPDLLAALTTDWDFMCDVARRMGSIYGASHFATLSTAELVDLYLWVDARLERIEYAPGRVYDGDSVQDLPNVILQTIGGREDDHAALALARIAEHRSSIGIRDYADQVQRAADAASWRPLSLGDFRAVLADAERRVVTTSAQLAVVVTEALHDYAESVAADAAVRRRLWVPEAVGSKPVTEERASDELRLELGQRLGSRVAVHREVRVEPRLGRQSAADVDLLVTIVDGESTISCIVEVKMNWFPTVVDRIKSQLVERYLAGPAADAGVFVVLWFAGADWDESDPRRRKALKDRRRFDKRLSAVLLDYVDRPVHVVVIDASLEQHP